jgi:hypothetical protein
VKLLLKFLEQLGIVPNLPGEDFFRQAKIDQHAYRFPDIPFHWMQTAAPVG